MVARRVVVYCGLWAVLSQPIVARAQGLMVRPTKFEVTMQPGQVGTIDTTISNTADRPVDAEIVPVVLLQGDGGSYQYSERGQVPAKAIVPRSCLDWLSIKPTSGRISAMGQMTTAMTLRVPKDGKGSYVCALLVRTKPEPGTGMRTSVQIVCPVVLTISGPQAQQRIELKDVELTVPPTMQGSVGTTLAGITVANAGETFERVSGLVTVSRKAGDGWSRVLQQTLPERGLFPGSTVRLTEDLKRRLPTGRYKTAAQLLVSGMSRSSIEREIDLQGDPNAPPLVDDVSLTVEPGDAELRVQAGSRRSMNVLLANPSKEDLNLSLRMIMPPELEGLALGQLKGPDLDCSSWVTVSPAEVILRGGAQRNVRLSVEVPATANQLPSHYALLQASVTSADGHVTSRPAMLLKLRDQVLKQDLNAVVVSTSFAHLEAAKYQITARFANIGSLEFSPVAKARLVTSVGQAAQELTMERPSGVVLPLGLPQFGTVMDFDKMTPGAYVLHLEMKYGDKTADASLKLSVAMDAKTKSKTVTVLPDAK